MRAQLHGGRLGARGQMVFRWKPERGGVHLNARGGSGPSRGGAREGFLRGGRARACLCVCVLRKGNSGDLVSRNRTSPGCGVQVRDHIGRKGSGRAKPHWVWLDL